MSIPHHDALTYYREEPDSYRNPSIHPGEILKSEFLDAGGITMYRLSKDSGLPLPRLSEICAAHRSITVETAIRLAVYFNTTIEFWMNLQQQYELEKALHTTRLNNIKL